MENLLLIDFARFSHVLTVTIGLGGAILADFYVFSRLKYAIEVDFIVVLKKFHMLVTWAIVAMWVTGLVMVYIRTGFVIESFSPKLFSKLGVVAILTANAVLIGKIAMPMLARNVGTRPLDLPFTQKAGVALLSGVSTVSWLLALSMGVSKVLANSPWPTFELVVPAAYIVAILGALTAIILIDGVRMVLRNIASRNIAQSKDCRCASCRREDSMLKELLGLRDDLMALQSARLDLGPALNFARPLRSANGEGGTLSIARDTFG